MKIINLTTHPATPKQVAAGVIDLPTKTRNGVAELFTKLKEAVGIDHTPVAVFYFTAQALANVAQDSRHPYAMIDCPPYFAPWIEAALNKVGVKPVYSIPASETPGDDVHTGWVHGYQACQYTEKAHVRTSHGRHYYTQG